MYKPRTVKVTCPSCGKVREKPESELRMAEPWEQGGYCSEECSRKARGDNVPGPSWTVGKSIEYPDVPPV